MRLSNSWAWGSVVYIMDKADGRGVEVWADRLLGWWAGLYYVDFGLATAHLNHGEGSFLLVWWVQ
ncbi:hypothetical protein Pyn_03327 [Prunus yedoensis var. nudiflora]|uniref:Uncharacterized protein n=1 Tax=Prunus yedoensis var. nudiflora TaxID=2094558 RepID=A0A314Z3C2_PRUYE|nr:hypothetical protein Pyn_03327 [Prunus yedoensis var. nudiflora]